MTDPAEAQDLEAAVVTYLKTLTRVTELCPADRISTRLRRAWSDVNDPAIRVRRIGGLPTEATANHLRRYRLQIDVFAVTETTAFAIATRVEAAVLGLAGQTLAPPDPTADTRSIVITESATDLAMANSPDPDSDAERYLWGAVLYAHPAAA